MVQTTKNRTNRRRKKIKDDKQAPVNKIVRPEVPAVFFVID